MLQGGPVGNEWPGKFKSPKLLKANGEGSQALKAKAKLDCCPAASKSAGAGVSGSQNGGAYGHGFTKRLPGCNRRSTTSRLPRHKASKQRLSPRIPPQIRQTKNAPERDCGGAEQPSEVSPQVHLIATRKSSNNNRNESEESLRHKGRKARRRPAPLPTPLPSRVPEEVS